MGMPSITRSAFPVPKLRVTLRSWIPTRPQEAQGGLDEVDRDDDEPANRTELDDCFGFAAGDRAAAEVALDFARVMVSLPFDDLSGEENAFEVEDREVVIFQLFCGVNGYDILQGTNELANPGEGQLRHTLILLDGHPSAQRRAKRLGPRRR